MFEYLIPRLLYAAYLIAEPLVWPTNSGTDGEVSTAARRFVGPMDPDMPVDHFPTSERITLGSLDISCQDFMPMYVWKHASIQDIISGAINHQLGIFLVLEDSRMQL